MLVLSVHVHFDAVVNYPCYIWSIDTVQSSALELPHHSLYQLCAPCFCRLCHCEFQKSEFLRHEVVKGAVFRLF